MGADVVLVYVVVGWGTAPHSPSFGGASNERDGVKAKIVNLITSVRTLMRSEF